MKRIYMLPKFMLLLGASLILHKPVLAEEAVIIEEEVSFIQEKVLPDETDGTMEDTDLLQIETEVIQDDFIEEIEIIYELQAESGKTVEQKVAEIAAQCLASGMKTDYEKAVWLHDWLTHNAGYDYTYSEYGPEGVLLKGTGVCQSYAEAYSMLLDCFEIENMVVNAPEMDHAWNIVKLDGAYCHVDCTWDDPGTGGQEDYIYFGMNDELMSMDHIWDTTVYPSCTETGNYYPVKIGYTVIRDRKELAAYLEKAAADRKKEFEFYYTGTDASFNLVEEFQAWLDKNQKKYGVDFEKITAAERKLNVSVVYEERKEDGNAHTYEGNDKALRTFLHSQLNKKAEKIAVVYEGYDVNELHETVYNILLDLTDDSCIKGYKRALISPDDQIMTVEIDYAVSHTYGGYIVTKEPTVKSAGEKIRKCSECGNTEKVSVPKVKGTMTLNVSELVLKTGQKAAAVQVTGLAAGDSVTSYKSSDKKIFTVDKKGKITAKKKAGTAKLTITLKSGYSKTIEVKVQKTEVKTTKISGVSKKVTLKKGKTYTLAPVITPITSVQKVTFTTSNKKIATVSSKGVITAKKKGTAKITVKSGSKKVTCTVKVKN